MNGFLLVIFICYEIAAVVVGCTLIIKQIKQNKFDLGTAVATACLSPIIWPGFLLKPTKCNRPAKPPKRIKSAEPIWHQWEKPPLCHSCGEWCSSDRHVCAKCGEDQPRGGWRRFTVRQAYNMPKPMYQYRLPDGTITSTFPGLASPEKAPQV